jgi:hypothetical protein
MKVKLNHSQMISLASVFQKFIGDDETPPPDNMQARLIYFHLNCTYKQLRRKLIDRKKKYTLQLTEPEAISFYIFFGQVVIPGIDQSDAIYKTVLVSNVRGAIDKFFSDN